MKIRISCTTQDELQINNKKINMKNYSNYVNNKFEDYIIKVFLLQKFKFLNNKTSYIKKSLEFICSRDITEEEFQLFIANLKKLGFATKKENHLIQYINGEGIVMFNYNYNLNRPYVIPAFSNKKKSLYRQQNLYIRN
jgi:1,2-phenylacetyl-CoA epoxidase catalytic subunit